MGGRVTDRGREGAARRVGTGPGPARGRGFAAGAVAKGTEIVETGLMDEVQQSYVGYALSVIVGRALPDARDGLKPVHRRILYAMHELKLVQEKPYRKSARVVGEVLGKYHPHGDTAVYDALVRMAQPFSMSVPLVQGHGNFGSIDSDPPAAMRYTECRLEGFASEALLRDLAFSTVDTVPNFDASVDEPTVLPARLPNLLINGSTGIAVGMATKIPPHNVCEIVAALKAFIQNPDIELEELLQHVPAPDFPTGGLIMKDASNLRAVYSNGVGKVTLRGRAHTEKVKRKGKGAREAIVITEIPYQTNKASLVENIADMVSKKVLDGVADLRDESDRSGMRVVLELKTGVKSNVVLNNLYKHSQLQVAFHCNMVAIVNGVPRTLSLKAALAHFLEFRCDVERRKATHELELASAREHLVAGMLLAAGSIEQVIDCIRSSDSSSSAGATLQESLGLSKKQTAAVLEMPLRRLNRLETGNLESEQAELLSKIDRLNRLLGSKQEILEGIMSDLDSLTEQYKAPRRTQLSEDDSDLSMRELIPNTESIVMLTRKGAIKRVAESEFSVQGRGGKGKAGGNMRQDDGLSQMLQVFSHDYLLFFCRTGRLYRLEAHQIPLSTRGRKGTPIPQIIPGVDGSTISALLPLRVRSGDESPEPEQDFIMVTRKGIIKRTPSSGFKNVRKGGMQAIKMEEGDSLGWVLSGQEGDSVIVGTASGKVLRFEVSAGVLNPVQTRSARGVKAIKLAADDSVVGMAVIPKSMTKDNSGSGPSMLFVTKHGIGKRVELAEFPNQGRAGMGRIGIRLNEGDCLTGMDLVPCDERDIVVATEEGLVQRCKVSDLPTLGRNTKGVKLVRLNDGDAVQSIDLLRS